MSEVIVTVRGEAERRVPPEQAVIQLRVHTAGPERGPVVERAAGRAAPLREDLIAHQRSGEVAEWSTGRVTAWSERPWNADGRQDAPVHHAAVDITATFRDFAALSWWAGEVAASDDVDVADVRWELASETRAEVERQVATEAVQFAVHRATAYAEALGRESVTPLELADAGLLLAKPDHPPQMFRAMAAESSGPVLALQPADIVVTAAVEARFLAS